MRAGLQLVPASPVAEVCAVTLEVGLVIVMTCTGPEMQYVDLALTRAPTKPCAPPKHVLTEMRVAACATAIRAARRDCEPTLRRRAAVLSCRSRGVPMAARRGSGAR